MGSSCTAKMSRMGYGWGMKLIEKLAKEWVALGIGIGRGSWSYAVFAYESQEQRAHAYEAGFRKARELIIEALIKEDCYEWNQSLIEGIGEGEVE